MSSKKLPFDPPVEPVAALLDADLARQVLKSAPTVLYVYDVQNEHIQFQNRRFGELLGHPEIAADEWRSFAHPDDERTLAQHRSRLKTIEAGETLFWEFRMRDCAGGWRWFLSRDVLLSRDDAGKPSLVVGNASDITEQKDAEEHMEILVGEMRHRAKNLISLVEGIGRLSRPKGQPVVDAFVDTYMGRLKALLRTGDIVSGEIRAPKQKETYCALLRVSRVNFDEPAKACERSVQEDAAMPVSQDHALEMLGL